MQEHIKATEKFICDYVTDMLITGIVGAAALLALGIYLLAIASF